MSTSKPDSRVSRLLCVPAVLALTASTLRAQDQLWIEQFGSGANEWTNDVAPDGSGGLFATGNTAGNLAGPNAGSSDAWLARRDGAGNPIWIRQFGTSVSDSSVASESDGQGGVFLGGSTAGSLAGPHAGMVDAWLARYDGAGNPLWMRQLGTFETEVCSALADDGQGGVFAVGHTYASLGGPNAGFQDAWIARYDAAGNQVWIRQVGASGFDRLNTAAPDAAGGVYVSGCTEGIVGISQGFYDVWLARYDGAGNQLWIRQFGTSMGDDGICSAPDGQGGVIVSGNTNADLGGPHAGESDVWLARYDDAGNQVWIRQFGTSVLESPQTCRPDGQGGVFLGGYTSGSLEGVSAGGLDAWFARYDGAGNRLWIQQFGTASADWFNAATLDGQGGLFAGGTTNGSLGGANAGGGDSWVGRFTGSCGLSVPYCTASTTSISGCQAAIGAVGSPSLSAPGDFTVVSGAVPGGNLGICFFGANGSASIPFGTLGGKICVNSPFYRSAPKQGGGTPGSCNGAFTFTLQDLVSASPIVVEGAVIHVEIWARDPANVDGFLLSNALRFAVCP